MALMGWGEPQGQHTCGDGCRRQPDPERHEATVAVLRRAYELTNIVGIRDAHLDVTSDGLLVVRVPHELLERLLRMAEVEQAAGTNDVASAGLDQAERI